MLHDVEAIEAVEILERHLEEGEAIAFVIGDQGKGEGGQRIEAIAVEQFDPGDRRNSWSRSRRGRRRGGNGVDIASYRYPRCARRS